MASFIVMSGFKVFWSKTSDAHEAIIQEFSLHMDGVQGPNGVRVEIVPTTSYSQDPSEWIFQVDQDITPDWWNQVEAEKATKIALQDWCAAKRFTQGIHEIRQGSVLLVGLAQATLYNSARATLCDSAQATLRDSAKATLHNSAQATLYNSAQATLLDLATAILYNSAQATLCDSAQATLRDSARATLYGLARAILYGSAQVTLKNASTVLAYDKTSWRRKGKQTIVIDRRKAKARVWAA